MADHIKEYNMNNTDMVMAFSVNDVKKEEEQNEDFTDNKFIIPETVIIANNPELQENLICNNMKLYNISSTLDNMKIELLPSEVHFDMVQDNLKIEESNSANDMKIEINNGLLYCEDCHTYYEDYCVQCGMLIHILNSTVLVNVDNTSQEELPDNVLEIQEYFGESHIFALKVIPVGVKFGPFTGLHRTECSWRVQGGRFAVNKDKLEYLNWMRYINPARNVSEQNLCVFQYECNLYYQSTRQIEEGDELLVYFGEEHEDSLNSNVEMDFIPTNEHIFKEAFACTFCCLGFSSKSYLVKHKSICSMNADRRFSIEELTHCLFCKIYLDRNEYFMHHMAYCCERNDRKCILPTSGNRSIQVNGSKARPRITYKCQQCKYTTNYKGDLDNHINGHYEVKMYKCGVCGRRFKTKKVLRLHVEHTHICADSKKDLDSFTGVYMNAHIKREHGMKPFNCSLCQFRTKYKGSLKMHMTVKHLKEFNYKCNKCDYRTNRKTYLKMHIKTRHLKVFKYKCDMCDYKSNIKFSLKTHVETRHLNVFKYKCDTCDYKARQKIHLNTHIEAKHLKEFKYKCETCEYKTNEATNIKRHINSKHLKEFKYKCETCEYKTNEATNIKRHINTKHLKEFKYKCDTCEFKTNMKSNLEKHIEAKHLKVFKYKCDKCDYKANFKYSLKAHVETKHLKEFKYKCDTCEFKTNQATNIKRHIETKHMKEFKYKCDTCEFNTNMKSKLEKHIEAKHFKVFKYKCEKCDYKANWPTQLKTHIETKHLKEFKYKCDTCDYKTNFKSDLRKHIEARHLKVFKHKCDACDYKANWKTELKIHIKTKHLKEFKYKCDRCDYKTNHTASLKRHIGTRHTK